MLNNTMRGSVCITFGKCKKGVTRIIRVLAIDEDISYSVKGYRFILRGGENLKN